MNDLVPVAAAAVEAKGMLSHFVTMLLDDNLVLL